MQSLVIIIIYVILLAITVGILRWALRINVIVEQLDDIAMSNQKIAQHLESLKESLDRKNDSSKQSGKDDESYQDE